MTRRSAEDRQAIERQAMAQSKLREAVMGYLTAHGISQDLAFHIATGSEEAERFVHIEGEIFTHLDQLIEEIEQLEEKA